VDSLVERSAVSATRDRSATVPMEPPLDRSGPLRRPSRGIDAIFGIEFDHDANQYVASPTDVQEFWDEHGQLPGFAVWS